ncbi:hypothetical protein FLL45_15750 [Aliikangiella marina]|uniref:Uncharacterized protein n=1 Tax=Aliikangiella marina TaxID=1712262 RepID=A0A545T6V5_9GAMM|nr:hypothetical protein [Aliikangiella marina]TQV72918.1 hypothetical protein FLL45_15750 [Aliikangiella marina]
MKKVFEGYELTLVEEKTYSTNSTDNIRSYKTELCRNSEYRHTCAHGVFVGDIESPQASTILLGVGGATGIHEDSIAYHDSICFIAAGDSVFALQLPSLELLWCRKVDFATCFGIYWVKEKNCLISWGEVDVRRLTKDGDIEWAASGSDIFTEGFELDKDQIEITDFNNDVYKIEIETGKNLKLAK